MVLDAQDRREWIVNFDLTEDEEMLKALTERFVTDHYNHDSRRAFQAGCPGFSSQNWQILAELGLIAAPFAEDVGGLGLDATGIATMFEALGRGLVVEPLAETVMSAGRLFAATAPAPLLQEWMEPLLGGRKRLALAHAEAGARDGKAWVKTTAEPDSDGFVLNGSKPYCIAGSRADGFIVSARGSGAPGDVEGVDLYLVPADAFGLARNDWALVDGTYAAALTLDAVKVPASHRLTGGLAALSEVETLAALARSAEALGIMERLFADTLDYLRTRDQFGAPIGTFQAIQHRMVAQYAAIEQSRALLNLALVSWGTDDFAKAVHGARAFIADASVELGHEMIQFHGGMGVTDELAIGSGHKRLLMLSRWPEGPLAALDRYAGLLN